MTKPTPENFQKRINTPIDQDTPLSYKEILKQQQDAKVPLSMYAFVDTKSLQIDTPFFTRSDLFAQRHHRMVFDNKTTMFNKFEDDYKLVRYGIFDTLKGTFVEDYKELTTIPKEGE